MKLDVTIRTIDSTSYTKFKGISVYKLISYLTRKFGKSLKNNITEGTKITGKHNASRRPKQVNQTNDNL
ncbi:hypothetical protein MED152_16980 [Polaribacter sp. MED152]|nr:hypothetical protein MED152_16980 [Polaribacter sp. MED152]